MTSTQLLVADDGHDVAAEANDLVTRIRGAHEIGPAAVASAVRDLGLEPMDGARNNHVYRQLNADGPPRCVKIYKVDDRRRLEREWNALTLLAGHGVTRVPRPLWCADHPHLPIMCMSLLPGAPVADLVDPAPALAALPDLVRQIHQVPLSVFRQMERIDSATHYVNRIMRVWPEQLLRHAQDDLTREMRDLLRWWRGTDDADLTCEWAPRVLSRGDSNLLNWLWDGHRIGVVDFEFSGYADRVFDAADLIEHISARPIDDAAWEPLLADLDLTSRERRRYLAARRTCAMRWLAVLWKHRKDRPDDFARQRERVHALRALSA
jgi:aminoglycoside phosphotransferase (APT) family kinase protein